VIGQCKPVSVSRRRSAGESFTATPTMVNLKMVAANLKPSKFTMICALLNDFVETDANGKRSDYILSDYEVTASYVEFFLRQILSGKVSISAVCSEDESEILIKHTGYSLSRKDISRLY